MKTINSSNVFTRSRMQTKRITRKRLARLSQSSELRRIASELGDAVNYFIETERGANFGLEFLQYRDEWVDVGGIASLLGESPKRISYSVDVRKVDFYIEYLEKHGSRISKEISENLKLRPKKDRKIPKGIASRSWYCAFGVDNFEELPELVKLHQKTYEH